LDADERWFSLTPALAPGASVKGKNQRFPLAPPARAGVRLSASRFALKNKLTHERLISG